MLSSLSEARSTQRHRVNELCFNPNTQVLFNDAKLSLQAVIASVKELIA